MVEMRTDPLPMVVFRRVSNTLTGQAGYASLPYEFDPADAGLRCTVTVDPEWMPVPRS
jgi:hypothetical protein